MSNFSDFKNGSLAQSNPVMQKIRNKTITAEKFASMVKSGDWIYGCMVGTDAVAPRKAIFQRLGDGPDKLQNIEMWAVDNAFLGTDFGLRYDKEGKYHIQHQGFIHKGTKDAIKQGWQGFDWYQWGWAMHMNYQFARFYRKEKSQRVADWGIATIAKPEGSYVNGSYGVSNFMITAKTCKKFVCEIREDHAWCEPGRNVNLHIDDVDYFIEVDLSDPDFQYPRLDERNIIPSETDKKIAEHILSIMRNGDVLQVGIGSLPTAVVLAISDSDLKHLGVHTEMIGEWAFTLIEKGKIDNSQKSIDQGRCAWAYAVPFIPERYFEWMHHNPMFAAYDINYTNNFLTLSMVDNFMGIMSFAKIDIRGQVVSSCVGGRPISNTGGQFQFTVGGQLSRGGRTVLAATSRTPDGKSRIVGMLDRGDVVDVPSQFVNYVATEYGIVNLMACTDAEKARKLISIAHPDDREELEKEAAKLGIKTKHWMFDVSPDRRYPSANELKDHKHGYMDLVIAPKGVANPNS
ncbi:4-hydroxybutyrate CoA-transferase [Desulfurella acetivorans A63]|nr:4-hydroxybutyrate CoA-transferase [Desulfurella acetivorans A63]